MDHQAFRYAQICQGVLIGVGFLVLGVLQYRSSTQINRTESEKAHQRVQEQADRYAMDFNREMQNAYFNFQTDSESWKTKNWSPFKERFDYWHERTQYPELIEDFYFFETNSISSPLKYDKVSRAFVPAEATADVAAIRTRISDEKSFHPVFDEIYTLALPTTTLGQRSSSRDTYCRRLFKRKIEDAAALWISFY